MKRLEGKTAVVFGAGCVTDGWGNGNATAVTFAREGANVVCVDLHEDAARRTAELVRAEGAESIHVAADVANGAQIQDVVEQTALVRTFRAAERHPACVASIRLKALRSKSLARLGPPRGVGRD